VTEVDLVFQAKTASEGRVEVKVLAVSMALLARGALPESGACLVRTVTQVQLAPTALLASPVLTVTRASVVTLVQPETTVSAEVEAAVAGAVLEAPMEIAVLKDLTAPWDPLATLEQLA